MPNDPPTEADRSASGVDGYAAYKVTDSATTHKAWGMGSYCFSNVNPSIVATCAFEVPDTPGVRFHDRVTVSLSGVGTSVGT